MNKAAAEHQINSEAQPLELDTLFTYFHNFLTPTHQLSNNGSINADMALCDPISSINSSIRNQNELTSNCSFQENQEHKTFPRTTTTGNLQSRRSSDYPRRLTDNNKKFVQKEFHRFKSQYVYSKRPVSGEDYTYNYCLKDISLYDHSVEDKEIADSFVSALHEIQMKIKRSSLNQKELDLTTTKSQTQIVKKNEPDKKSETQPGKDSTPPLPFSDLMKYSQLATPISYIIDQLGLLSRNDGETVSNNDSVPFHMKDFISDVSSMYASAKQLVSRSNLIYSNDSFIVYDYLRFFIRHRLRGNKIFIGSQQISTDKFFREYFNSFDLTRETTIRNLLKNFVRLSNKLDLRGDVLCVTYLLMMISPKLNFKVGNFFDFTILQLCTNISSRSIDKNLQSLIDYFRMHLSEYNYALNFRVKDLLSHYKFQYVASDHLFRILLYSDYLIRNYDTN